MRRNRKFIFGVFNDGESLTNAVTAIRHTSNPILDCFTPFPVHGLERAMGVKRSRLGVVAFCCGATGFTLALLLQWYTMVHDWPINIGGKPSQIALPSFVPVCFELTILCTAFGMGIFFFLRAGLAHGVRANVLDPRASDDKFLLCFDLENHNVNADEVSAIMKQNGAAEVNTKEVVAKEVRIFANEYD